MSKKKLTIILSSIAALVLVLALLFVGGIVGYVYYVENIHGEPIVEYQSDNGEYTLEIQQIGSPKWSFGPVKARFILKQDGETIENTKLWVYNDGAGLGPMLFEVEWAEDEVVVVIHQEGDDGVLRMDYQKE